MYISADMTTGQWPLSSGRKCVKDDYGFLYGFDIFIRNSFTVGRSGILIYSLVLGLDIESTQTAWTKVNVFCHINYLPGHPQSG